MNVNFLWALGVGRFRYVKIQRVFEENKIHVFSYKTSKCSSQMALVYMNTVFMSGFS